METIAKAQGKEKANDLFMDKYISVHCTSCHTTYYYYAPHKDSAFFMTANMPLVVTDSDNVAGTERYFKEFNPEEKIEKSDKKGKKHVTGSVYDSKCQVYYEIDLWVDVK